MVRHRKFWDSHHQRPKTRSWAELAKIQEIQTARKDMQQQENEARETTIDDELTAITRITQKMNSQHAALLQKEFDKKSTALGEARFKESCALMKEEGAERKALLETMHHENPETQKFVREFTDSILQNTLKKINEDAAEKNKLLTQEMANRHATANQETHTRLSFWQQLQQKPEPKKPAGKISLATQKRLDRLNGQPTETKRAATTTQPPRAKSPGFVHVDPVPQDTNAQKPAETGLFWKILGY